MGIIKEKQFGCNDINNQNIFEKHNFKPSSPQTVSCKKIALLSWIRSKYAKCLMTQLVGMEMAFEAVTKPNLKRKSMRVFFVYKLCCISKSAVLNQLNSYFSTQRVILELTNKIDCIETSWCGVFKCLQHGHHSFSPFVQFTDR